MWELCVICWQPLGSSTPPAMCSTILCVPYSCVLQSGLREHRWRLILSVLLHILYTREVHSGTQTDWTNSLNYIHANVFFFHINLGFIYITWLAPSSFFRSTDASIMKQQLQKTCPSGVCAPAGVVNQADDRDRLQAGYFTTPGWHCTTANEDRLQKKQQDPQFWNGLYFPFVCHTV